MPTTHISGLIPPRSAPAEAPTGSAETPTRDEDLALVTDYETFAWTQEFTLVEPLPAPAFLDLLDVIIERVLDPEIRVRAMRMAAGVAERCHERYMRSYLGYDAHNGPPESEAASRDPHTVERHLILTASLALEVGDPQFPRLAAGWLGIPSNVAAREAYLDLIESPGKVLRAVQTEAPGQFLRAVVHGRVGDCERLRPQRARGQNLLSIYDKAYKDRPVAEFSVEAQDPFIDNLLQLLRARPGKKAARLVSVIERMRDGHTKDDCAADYQYLRDNAPLLAKLLGNVGVTSRPDSPESGAKSPVSTQPWVRERIRGMDLVAHRYHGEAIDVYGAIVAESFAKLKNSSYFSPRSVAGR